MLSGDKVMSRRLVKSMQLLSSGFEIETELAVHALSLRAPIAEMPTPYRDRPANSASKLRTIRDGARISRTIIWLIKDERPLPFFATTAAVLVATAAILGLPISQPTSKHTSCRAFPTAVLAASIMLVALLSPCCGMILDTVNRGQRETKRIAYLASGAVDREKNGGRQFPRVAAVNESSDLVSEQSAADRTNFNARSPRRYLVSPMRACPVHGQGTNPGKPA